jgi:hypothetical protein
VATDAGEEINSESDESADEQEWDPDYHHDPFVRQLRRLKELQNHQKRGYEFQDFVGSLFKYRHFNVMLSPGTAKPRQTDLLAQRGSDSYLIETKWRSSKANINDIDSLYNRLDAAPAAVVGLMVSYAGFTEEAIKKVELRSDRPVVLLTGEELEKLVKWDGDLVQLMSQKKTALLAHRRAVFSGARRGRGNLTSKRGEFTVASAEYAYLDGTRAKWISAGGRFGEFTFAQELPDTDWVPGEGRSVALDIAVPVFDERGIVTLLHHLSDMGWATGSARWSIQQTATNWHGIGTNDFAEALQGWRARYKGIDTHHSEEFCYFDKCDGGFYSLTAKVSAYDDRSASYAALSFQLTGIPLDSDPLKELCRRFDVSEPCYFRPLKRKSVVRRWNLPGPFCIPLEPVAFIVERDNVFGDKRDWVRGLVAKNPFYLPDSPLNARVPDWIPAHVFNSEVLICDLRSWHLLSGPKQRYELWGCESARTADAVIVHPIAEWPDEYGESTEERAPKEWRTLTEMVNVADGAG